MWILSRSHENKKKMNTHAWTYSAHTHTHTHTRTFLTLCSCLFPTVQLSSCHAQWGSPAEHRHFISCLGSALQLLVPNYWDCCQSKESDDRLSSCQAPGECPPDLERQWMNWNPPTRCPESEFSVFCVLVRSGFNLSCLVCAADQYQLYYKGSRAKPMCTVSTCTQMDRSRNIGITAFYSYQRETRW